MGHTEKKCCLGPASLLCTFQCFFEDDHIGYIEERGYYCPFSLRCEDDLCLCKNMALVIFSFINDTFILNQCITVTKLLQFLNGSCIRIIELGDCLAQSFLYVFDILKSIHSQSFRIHMDKPVPGKCICHQSTVLDIKEIFVIILLKYMFLTQSTIQFCQSLLCLPVFFQTNGFGNILMRSADAYDRTGRRFCFPSASGIPFT